jgi:hypothetical protein
MQSFSKKIKTLLKVGINSLEEGLKNFKSYDQEAENSANKRLFDCVNCDSFVDEPIKFLKITDNRIPELSGKMCDECGCILSYKLRQSISKCDKWQK